MVVEVLSAWLITYVLHSSILLGAVWGITLMTGRIPDGVKEILWKVAWFGGLLTTTWQCAAGTEPVVGSVPLPAVEVVDPVAQTPGPRSDTAVTAVGPGVTAGPRALPVAPGPERAARAAPREGGRTHLAGPGLLGYGILVVLALAHLWWRRACLWRRLGGRETVTGGAMPLLLARLARRAGCRRKVRLTHSRAIATPIAFGHTRPEICLPSRALAELAATEQEAMLAHELAHLLRRDPAWLLVCQVLARVLFLQPLHLVAQRRLRELAEVRCDAWAATHARDRLSVARCLVAVAGWLTPNGTGTAPAPAMASRGSELRRRVERLLDGPPVPAPVGGRRITALAVAAVLAAAAVLPNAAWRGPVAAEPPSALAAALALPRLENELDLLRRELASLRAAVGTPADPALATLLADIERQAGRLDARREHLRTLLTDFERQHRPAADSTPRDRDRHDKEHP